MHFKLAILLLLCSPLVASADTIAIIGTGNVGIALGTEFAAQGHSVIYGSRSPLSLKTMDAVTRTGPNTSAKRPADAAALADVIVLAVPGTVTEAVARNLGDLSGKIVIDATNPLVAEGDPPVFSYGVATSLGEIVQEIHPDAHVVKALNTISWQQMMDPKAANTPPVVPLAGNNDDAKKRVAGYVEGMGLDPLDLGGIEISQWTERMVVIMLNNRFTGAEKFDLIFQRRD